MDGGFCEGHIECRGVMPKYFCSFVYLHLLTTHSWAWSLLLNKVMIKNTL